MAGEKCFVCGMSCWYEGRLRGASGACQSCYMRLKRRLGSNWMKLAQEAISDGRKSELMCRNYKPPVSAPADDVEVTGGTVYLTRERMEQAAQQAYEIAKKNPSVRAIPVAVSGTLESGVVIYFTPFLDKTGRLDVKPLTE